MYPKMLLQFNPWEFGIQVQKQEIAKKGKIFS